MIKKSIKATQIFLVLATLIGGVMVANFGVKLNKSNLDENSFFIGESKDSALKKIQSENFDYIDVKSEKIFASKKTVSNFGYVELRVILQFEDEKILTIWVKEFNHSI